MYESLPLVHNKNRITSASRSSIPKKIDNSIQNKQQDWLQVQSLSSSHANLVSLCKFANKFCSHFIYNRIIHYIHSYMKIANAIAPHLYVARHQFQWFEFGQRTCEFVLCPLWLGHQVGSIDLWFSVLCKE